MRTTDWVAAASATSGTATPHALRWRHRGGPSHRPPPLRRDRTRILVIGEHRPRTDEHAVLQHRRLVDHRVVLELAAVAHPHAYARRWHPGPRCSCFPAPRPRARVPGATQTSPPRAAHRQPRQRSPELEPSPLPHLSTTSDVRAATRVGSDPSPELCERMATPGRVAAGWHGERYERSLRRWRRPCARSTRRQSWLHAREMAVLAWSGGRPVAPGSRPVSITEHVRPSGRSTSIERWLAPSGGGCGERPACS